MSETDTEKYIRKLNQTDQPAGESTDILTQATEVEAELDPYQTVKPQKSKELPIRQEENPSEEL